MTQAPQQDLPSDVAAGAATTDTTGAYAIVEASGQQFWLLTDRYVDLDRLSADVDSNVTLE
ncbi:50S ribosomal protein L21, partial [Cyanobium sp. N5-Cardenillas]|nr:50S ribosomal protein L21 [Cyanobium sp. N5-Cardenillas]